MSSTMGYNIQKSFQIPK